MNNFDPRTCKSYANYKDNPLMQEYMKEAGWNKKGTILSETDTNKAPTDYGKTNPQEDLAEAAMLYLYEPDTLKNRSPARYNFLKKLYGD